MGTCLLVLFGACSNGGSDADEAQDDSGPVSAVGSVTNEIPQDASLAADFLDGVLTVTNDGNITMSNVAVEDGNGAEVCDVGTLAPQASAPCPEAGGTWKVTGEGPQGQSAEASS